MSAICFFCGSAPGNDPLYQCDIAALIETLAQHECSFVYGGGKVGLMGFVADEGLKRGASVTGIIPRHLVDHELAYTGLTELVVTDDMHQRKLAMALRSDAFIALPGGVGTLEEIFEQWTWSQIGLHAKPCVFFNTGGFFDPLIAFLQKVVDKGFMKPQYLETLIVSDDPDEIVARLKGYTAPADKWSKVVKA